MDKKNICKKGGARPKGPREQLSSLPAPSSSSQSYITQPLDLLNQPYDVGGLRQALFTDSSHFQPTGHTLQSGFDSNDVSLDSVLAANLDYDLNSYPNLDFDLQSYILEEESNTSQESLESERWTPGDEWSLEGEHSQTSVTFHQSQFGPMSGTDMGAITSAVLPSTSDQVGGMVGITTGLLSPSGVPESGEQYRAVGGTTLDNLTSAVLPGSTDHLNFQVSCLHRYIYVPSTTIEISFTVFIVLHKQNFVRNERDNLNLLT